MQYIKQSLNILSKSESQSWYVRQTQYGMKSLYIPQSLYDSISIHSHNIKRQSKSNNIKQS